jgi:uncharacterized membrane protein YhfC
LENRASNWKFDLHRSELEMMSPVQVLLYTLSFLLMLALPIALAVYIQRRWRPGWALLGIGALTFVVVQVVCLPLYQMVVSGLGFSDLTAVNNAGSRLFLAMFSGVLVGLLAEPARYLAYRFGAKTARDWRQGLMLGAGYGGLQAIWLALLTGFNLAVLLADQWSWLRPILSPDMITAVYMQYEARLPLAQQMAFVGPLEQLFFLSLHLAASLLVLQLFLRGQWHWLLAAIGWHALLVGVTTFAKLQFNTSLAAVAMGLLTLGNVAIIWQLCRQPVTAVQT